MWRVIKFWAVLLSSLFVWGYLIYAFFDTF